MSTTLIASLLPLFVAVPLLAGGLLVLAGERHRIQSTVMFTVLGVSLVASVLLVIELADGATIAHGAGGWPFGVSIPFAADMFTALMLLTTSILAVVCAWFAEASGFTRQRYFAPLVLILMVGVNGSLLTADLFNFFVFIEVMLLPSYGLYVLVTSGRSGLRMIEGIRLYVSANLLASTMLLAGVAFVYGTAGTVNLGELAGMAGEDPAVALSMAIVMLAMMIKAAVVPVHSWLARTYPYTSPAVTALFSGLHTKVGVYAVYRFYAVTFEGDTRWLWIGVLLFSLTMLLGVLGAVGEKGSREILVFHMVSQLGYILLGVALFTELGLTAGIFYLVHHMLVKAALFMATGAVEVRYGTGEIGKVSEVARREPVIAVAFFIAALSLAGIPPFSGFVAKFSLMVGAWEAGEIAAVVVMVLVSLVTLLSMLKIWGGIFWGNPAPDPTERASAKTEPVRPGGAGAPEQGGRIVTESATAPTAPVVTAADGEEPDRTPVQEPKPTVAPGYGPPGEDAVPGRRISGWLAAPAVILAVATVVIGLGAEVLLSLSETAAHNLLDISGYVEAVSNS